MQLYYPSNNDGIEDIKRLWTSFCSKDRASFQKTHMVYGLILSGLTKHLGLTLKSKKKSTWVNNCKHIVAYREESEQSVALTNECSSF